MSPTRQMVLPGDSDWDIDAAARHLAMLLCGEPEVEADRWCDMYLSRHGWGRAKLTLDAIGTFMGLSRQRVDQVMRKIDAARPLSIETLPSALAEAALAVDWSAPAGEVSALLGDLGMTDRPEEWTAGALIDIFDACGRADLASELKRRQAQGALDRKIPPELISTVREARSGLGVIDLRAVRFQGEWLTPNQALRVVESTYSEVVSVGAWALCRGQKRSAMENAVIRAGTRCANRRVRPGRLNTRTSAIELRCNWCAII